MDAFQLDIVNQAVTNLLIGFGLALVNVIVRYFVPRAPRFIKVLGWPHLQRALIAAYLIALVIQLATSPFFRSAFHPVSYELAWSPYQAIFNVLGVVVMDLIVWAWTGMRRGAEVGRQQLSVARERAADGLDEIGTRLAITPEGREEHAARQQAQAETEQKATAERKQRIDERLKDY